MRMVGSDLRRVCLVIFVVLIFQRKLLKLAHWKCPFAGSLIKTVLEFVEAGWWQRTIPTGQTKCETNSFLRFSSR